MKSKPPNKKSRIEDPSSSSSSSSTGGGMSKKDLSSKGGNTTTITTTSDIFSTKLAAGSSSSSSSSSSSNMSYSSTSLSGLLGNPSAFISPTFPKYSIPDLINSKDFTRMGQLISIHSNPAMKDSISGADSRSLENVSMEDLDGIQMELEKLWNSIALRIRSLQREQAALQNSPNVIVNRAAVLGEHFDPHHQEKINAVATLIDAGHGTRTSVSAAAKLVMGSQVPTLIGSVGGGAAGSGGGTSSSRKSNNHSTTNFPSIKLEKQAKKKLKGELEPKNKRTTEKPARAGQNRTHSMSMSQDDSSLLRQESPSQFWEFSDSYCRELTQENLDALEKYLEEHKTSLPNNLFDIPPLGKRFNNLNNNSSSSDNINQGGRGGSGNIESAATTAAALIIRPSEKVDTLSRDVCGPLTQRLVSALVEDRVSGYNHLTGATNQREDLSSPGGGDQGCFIHRPGLVRALGLDGGQNQAAGMGGPPLETRLRQVLLEQGLLLGDDAEDTALINPDDEILADIKRTQSNLRMIHVQNADKLRELHSLATRELERSVYKKDLAKADEEVLSAYRMTSNLKAKKKPLSKKEKDFVTRALESRNSVILKLQQQQQLTTNPALSFAQ